MTRPEASSAQGDDRWELPRGPGATTGSTPSTQEQHPKASTAGWADLCHRLGSSATSGALEAVAVELLGRWSEPHRHYHNRAHLAFVLDAIDTLAGAAAARGPSSGRQPGKDQPAGVQSGGQRTGAPSRAHDLAAAAAWYHDAIYDPTRSDNEERSAALAREQLDTIGVGAGVRDEVMRLVLLTRGHQPALGDAAGRLLCDADLAILATAPEVYERYAGAVRVEYAHLPDEEYHAGRIAVLEDLRRRALFHTSYARQHWETAARANLDRELRTLNAARSGGVPPP